EAAASAGDIPASPAFVKGAAMIGGVVAQLANRFSGRRGKNASCQHPRHSQTRERFMTLQAVIAPQEERRVSRVLVERVEDDSLLSVMRGDFHKWLALDPSDGDRVVEENASGVPRADDAL